MTSPSVIQIFFANQWPAKLWFGAWTISMPVGAIIIIEPTCAYLSDWHALLSFAVVIVVSPMLGFFLGVFAGSMVLPPIYELRERLNGGPFQVGDSVQILVGPHKGKITQVVSPWQGRSYCVRLDEESKKRFKDVFLADQLIKERDAELPP